MDSLPLELLCHVALFISDATSFRSFCATERRMVDTFQSLHFRIQWLTHRHPNFAALFSPNETRATKGTKTDVLNIKEIELLPAQVIADANALNVTLSTSSWRSYFECWLRQFTDQNLPIVPEDAKLRDALVIHAWKEVIPRFVRNQLLPPLDDDWGRVSVSDGRIGPNFEKIMNWFLNACGRDDVYLNNYHTGPAVTTEIVLPEGLIDASHYAWLMDAFRPGWLNKLMGTTFDGIEISWVHWLNRSSEKGLSFNGEGLTQFMHYFRSLVDP